MNILHLYSDWKWTGPAEPVIQMCKSLESLGHKVTFACRKTPLESIDCKETVEMKAAEYAINFTTKFALNRYLGLKDTWHDLIELPKFIEENKIDVVHTHLSHDHVLGKYIAWKLGKNSPVIVKSMHYRDVLSRKFWNRQLLKNLKAKDGLLVYTKSFKQKYIEKFGISSAQIGTVPMPLDLDKFNVSIKFTSQRKKFNIPDDSVLIGIVARFQKYRRMDVFMQAARKLVDKRPSVRFLVIGRSGQMENTVIRPMKDLGLEKNIILPGYLIDNYVDTLATLDIFTLMVPGFDGTARAMREAMALAVPCVVSNTGMLPDIVENEKTGLIFELSSSDELANAWIRLVDSCELRKKMGTKAAQYAKKHFRIELVGTEVENFYKTLN